MGEKEGGAGSGNGAVEQNEKERRGSLTLSLESDSSQSQYNRGRPLFSSQPPPRLKHGHCNRLRLSGRGGLLPARVIRLSRQPPGRRGGREYTSMAFSRPPLFPHRQLSIGNLNFKLKNLLLPSSFSFLEFSIGGDMIFSKYTIIYTHRMENRYNAKR